MKTTSINVCASLPEVRQRPSGLPKYSSYQKTEEVIRHVFIIKRRWIYVDCEHNVYKRQRRKDDDDGADATSVRWKKPGEGKSLRRGAKSASDSFCLLNDP
jgi:hypothetical protein